MPFRFIREFIKLESSSGIILFLAAACALIINNTSLSHYYVLFLHTSFQISLGTFILNKPLQHWINDGFMSLFFLLVGLEIKREIVEGELNSVKKATLPLIAAIGGMLGPALVYMFMNRHDPIGFRGWAIPAATDTAFALGILTMLGKRIPVQIKIFLTALAIFDDIGAIIIMAVFYSANISLLLLFVSFSLIGVLLLLNYLNVQRLSPYCIVGLILWICVLKSGVHATLAGIIVAFIIPIKNSNHLNTTSPAHYLLHKLHPWVAFGILPLFAFANAGVSFSGTHWSDFLSPIPLGICLGLFLGKQIGIWCATMTAVKLNIAHLPRDITRSGLYGLSLIAGVGFTMSLFIGSLAFHAPHTYLAYVRMGIISGSLMSGALGYWVLRWAY